MASNQWSTYTQDHTHTRVYIVTNKFLKNNRLTATSWRNICSRKMTEVKLTEPGQYLESIQNSLTVILICKDKMIKT